MPASRGEVRGIYQRIRRDLKWFAVVSVVGNQTLSHVDIPTYAGVTGAAIALALASVKLFLAR